MKKILSFFVLCILSICLFSCGEKETLKEILDEQIFIQSEDVYYIYFFRDGCSGCEKIKPTILDYVTISKKEGLPPLYGVNLAKEGEDISLIYRENPEKNGQGTDGKYLVDGISLWGRLYIATTPSLIKIEKVDGVKVASYVAQGNDITPKLQELV